MNETPGIKNRTTLCACLGCLRDSWTVGVLSSELNKARTSWLLFAAKNLVFMNKTVTHVRLKIDTYIVPGLELSALV